MSLGDVTVLPRDFAGHLLHPDAADLGTRETCVLQRHSSWRGGALILAANSAGLQAIKRTVMPSNWNICRSMLADSSFIGRIRIVAVGEGCDVHHETCRGITVILRWLLLRRRFRRCLVGHGLVAAPASFRQGSAWRARFQPSW